MRTAADWSIEAVGVALSLCCAVHLIFDPNRGYEAVQEVALPLMISVGIVALGWESYRRSIIVETRRRTLTTLGLVTGGVLFGLILLWAIRVGATDRGLTGEALAAVLLNAGSLGMLSGGAITAALVQLRRHRDELREKNTRLEKLTSIVAHDLKNPLNVAHGRAELARQTGDTDHLAVLTDALDRMEGMIENTLILSQEHDSVDITTVVELETIATAAWTMVESEDVVLQIEQSMQFQADKSTLRHVFENLFANAIEHGGSDVSTIRVGTLDSRGFYVEDDGRGFPDSPSETLTGWGQTDDDGATGLGLAIAEEITTAHGWTLDITESSEGGARVEITGIDPWEG